MINNRLLLVAAALIISFVCPPEIVNVGLEFFKDDILNPLPCNTCVPTTRVKKKIFSALKTLKLNGQQSVLVQLWSPTKAGNTYLLNTCPSFGYYGTDKGLKVYRKGCLRHAFYIHLEENVSFGLPGRAFMEGTPQQTQDVHDYPEDQRPLCEDNDIFLKKWGSFAVPVILDAERVGALEFVMTGPTGRYDELMNEVCNALELAGFQSSLKLDAPRRTNFAKKSKSLIKHDATKETESSNKKTRTTQSSKYAHYNVLVPLFGLSKAEAMKEIESIFHLKKKVIDSTFTNALRNKVGIPEWPCIRNTHSRASSSATELSEAASSIETPDFRSTFVCDTVISEKFRESTSTPIASAYEAQLYQTPLETNPVADEFNQYCSGEQTPTIEPSALGPSERLLAIEHELMEEDQDDLGVHDHRRSNDMLKSFEECLRDTSGGMEIDEMEEDQDDLGVRDHGRFIAPHMGLSKAEAMKMVVSTYQLKRPVKEGTFSNAHKSAGIPEWPRVRSKTTRPSAAPQTNPTASQSSTTADSFGTPISDLTSSWDRGISDMSWEQTAMTNNASPLETQIYDIPWDARYFATGMTTDDGNPDLAWTGNVLENMMLDDSIFSDVPEVEDPIDTGFGFSY